MENKIIYASGQMCNQFWAYSNFIADAIDKDEKIGILAPSFDIENFPELYNSKYISFPLFTKQLVQLLGFKYYQKYIRICLANKFSIKIFRVVFWLIPGIKFITEDVSHVQSKNRRKYLKQLRNTFTPRKEIMNEVNFLFESKRKKFDIIIGIHIRYGDYRTFEDGKYFYELDEYGKIMNQMLTLIENRNIIFFVASNEKNNYEIFKKYNYFCIDNSNEIKDLMGLSLCDYIVGPPSSYSAWASIYRHTPLYFIENLNANISKEKFMHIEDFWF